MLKISLEKTKILTMLNRAWTLSVSWKFAIAVLMATAAVTIPLAKTSAQTFTDALNRLRTSDNALLHISGQDERFRFNDKKVVRSSIVDPTTLCGSDASMVGCWQMEENGGTVLVDGSSQGNNGAFTGTPSWVTGRTGDYALYLTGTQFAAVPDAPSLDLTTGMTVTAWVRPNLSSTYMYVLTKNVNTGGTAVNGYDFSLTSAHLVRIRLNNSTVLNSTTTYPHDGVTWMHIAATWDGSTVRLYLNGVQEPNTAAFSGPIQTNNLPLAIGSQNTSDPRPFFGNLDDIRLYNRALTGAEVQALANVPPTVYTISGNAGAAGVTLSYNDGTPKTATANSAGNYSFTIPTGWSGTVTPSLAGYAFTPSARSYTNVRSDQTAQNYSAQPQYVISGNAGTASAVLYYTDATLKTTVADGAGNYSITIPSGWSGSIVPTKPGYTFAPEGRTYNNVIADLGGEDYTASAGAATYYVDNTNGTCTDLGPGASPLIPFCTITKAANVAGAGSTVRVLHGTYAETVYPNTGVSGSPLVFKANPGVSVTGDPDGFGSAFAISLKSYIVIDGFNIVNTPYKGIYVDASDHITIINNHVSYAGVTSATHPYEQGIYLRGTTDSTINGNTTDHNTCIGIRLVGSDRNVVSKNVSFSNYSIVETDAAGIELTGSSYNTVIHNITYSNEDSGINVYVWTPESLPDPVPSTYNLIVGNLTMRMAITG
jgi:parallel beta-helix repeat protein